MEYSFRPQWRQNKFSFPSCQRPACGRCGNVHPNALCFAFNQKCYRCHRIGHYSRMCFTQMKKPTKCVEKEAVFGRKKTRDMKRLCKYLENKRSLRELPFNSLRNNQFHSLFDTSSILRTQLHSIKIQLRMSNQLTKSMDENLRSAESEKARLQSENTDLNTKFQENSKRSEIDMYVKKIQKLEEDAHGDKLFMDLMQRNLKDTRSEHNQYVMKIQTEAGETTKQLREQNTALLQIIWALECDKEHLESVLLDKQLDRRFQPHRHQRRQQRGYFR